MSGGYEKKDNKYNKNVDVWWSK